MISNEGALVAGFGTNQAAKRIAKSRELESALVCVLVLSMAGGCSGQEGTRASSVFPSNADLANASHTEQESVRSASESEAVEIATAFLQRQNWLFPEYRTTARSDDEGVWRVLFTAIPGGPGQFLTVHVGPDGSVLRWHGGE